VNDFNFAVDARFVPRLPIEFPAIRVEKRANGTDALVFELILRKSLEYVSRHCNMIVAREVLPQRALDHFSPPPCFPPQLLAFPCKLRARISLRSYRMPPINLLHDPLCPADSIRYGSYGSWHPRSAVVLCQFTGRQNRGGDQQYALPALIHSGSLAVSLCIRHDAVVRADADARGERSAMPEATSKRFVRGDKGRKQGLQTAG
jgi:hypothetical protein